MKIVLQFLISASLATTSIACVSAGAHEAALAAHAKTSKKLSQTQGELDKARQALENEKNELAANRAKADSDRNTSKKRYEECDDNLSLALGQNATLVSKVQSMGANVDQLLGEKNELSVERQALNDELAKVRRAIEARNSEYRSLISKLRKMIDAGTLQVKIRKGRLVVQMSSDVLFPAGGTKIKKDASEAIASLAKTIAQFSDRKFQVVGHSDSTPIHTARFPSNWELSSQRAIEVVKLMVEAGVPAEMLSAAGNAEFDPMVEDVDAESKEINRRVEIVFMTKIDEMPGIEEALAGQ
ncbi:OmpA family protein [Myxococcota bacterium]|nr:OmpA family protein [Myxococcota bacterium]